MFKKIILVLFSCSLLSACASSPSRTPSGEKIASGVNTIVVASNKSAQDFVRELKYRALEKDYDFDKTDVDTFSFLTEMMPLSKKLSVQIKTFVKDVKGGSNAIITGRYLKRKSKKQDVEKISNKSGANRKPAWDALFDFATFDKGAKYNFIER